MKLLLIPLATILTLSSQAQIVTDKSQSELTMTCMLVIFLISVLIAAVIYLGVNNNKRRRIKDNNSSEKTI